MRMLLNPIYSKNNNKYTVKDTVLPFPLLNYL